MGGENCSARMRTPSRAGSSPRGRGKPSTLAFAAARSGLIPAWAGKTPRLSRAAAYWLAHPRVGGENSRPAKFSVDLNGSSPRGRGKRVGGVLCGLRRRLIPAWAGKTRGEVLQHGQHWAHPRVGGENPKPAGPAQRRYGSSPRGRGKRRRAPGVSHEHGLIPAWAGKTLNLRGGCREVRAHPRVGGENGVAHWGELPPIGSSPRGRGKRQLRNRGRGKDRLIPAWAGKTTAVGYETTVTWAHPRVGGENGQVTDLRAPDSGSSPRGRGKRDRGAQRDVDERLIPAWAGKTGLLLCALFAHRAHPRVGGENCA